MDRALLKWADSEGAKVAVLDNSIGVGRLVRFADPKKHFIGGVDIHEPSVSALASVLDASGFECDVVAAGMEATQPRGFGVGIINPPFSIHLESSLLAPFPCTTWGRFGPNTGALSHEYAVYQALDACRVVVALVSRSYAESAASNTEINGRLSAVFHCPPKSFSEEGTDVAVSILVFGSGGRLAKHPCVSLCCRVWTMTAQTLGCPAARQNSASLLCVAHASKRMRLPSFCRLRATPMS